MEECKVSNGKCILHTQNHTHACTHKAYMHIVFIQACTHTHLCSLHQFLISWSNCLLPASNVMTVWLHWAEYWTEEKEIMSKVALLKPQLQIDTCYRQMRGGKWHPTVSNFENNIVLSATWLPCCKTATVTDSHPPPEKVLLPPLRREATPFRGTLLQGSRGNNYY